MRNRNESGLKAVEEALKARRLVGRGAFEAVCVYDCVGRLGIEVLFVDIPSLEGMYRKNPDPLILISSLRPAGRRAFTCAHELGHHLFNHGWRVDELKDHGTNQIVSDPAEVLADQFAGYFLMPKSAVTGAFARRKWKIETCSPLEFYTVAGWLGVGYTTLVHHMQRSLKLLSTSQASSLFKREPKDIRATLLPDDASSNLIIVDLCWTDRAIDIQVGDFLLLPAGVQHEGNCIEFIRRHPNGELYRGIAPGRGRFHHPACEWAAYVRVSRKDYVGRSLFRHEEDPDYGNDVD